MATPAAILSVLVEANATAAATTLTKFDKQLAATNTVARKGIEARLGANFNPTAFNAYDERLSRAARVARDRAAFKAELGANFNNSAFNAYERGIDKASKATEEARSHTERLSGSFREMAKTALEAGGVFLAFEKGKEAIESTLELSHATEHLSAVTGMDAKAGSQWLEVMKVRGVATTQGIQGFIALAKQTKAAQDGSTKNGAAVAALTKKQQLQLAVLKASGASQTTVLKTQIAQTQAMIALTSKSAAAAAAFKELGVSQATLASGNLTNILKAAADGLKNIENPARRAALAQQLFGRGAQALMPILAEGSKGVEEALAATQRYGAYLPTNVKQMEAARQANFDLQYAMDGLKISFTQKVLPALVAGAGKLLDFIQQMRNGTGAGGQFASAISTAFGVVKSIVTTVIGAVGGIGNALEIAVGAYALSKIVKFGRALAEVADLVRRGPGMASKAWGVLTGSAKAGELGGAKSLSTSVATMEVAEMIVKNMIGGPGGGGGGGVGAAAGTAEKSVAVAEGAAVADGLAAKLGTKLSNLSATAALRVTAAAGVGIGAFRGIAEAQSGVANQLKGALHGVAQVVDMLDPLAALGVQLADIMPGFKRRVAITAQNFGTVVDPSGAARNRFIAGQDLNRFQNAHIGAQRGSAPGSGVLANLTLDAQRAALTMRTLSATSAATFSAIANAAKATNDLPFSFADRVASDMLRAKDVNRQVVGDLLTTLRRLPAGAQAQAANTAIGMAAQLEAKGALPKNSAERIRAAITGSFAQMRVDSVAQATLLVTGAAKPLTAFENLVANTVQNVSAMLSGVVSSVQSLNFSKPALGLHGVSALTSRPPAGVHLKASAAKAAAAVSPAAQAQAAQNASDAQLQSLLAQLGSTTQTAAATKAAKAASTKATKATKVAPAPVATPIPSQLVGAQTRMAELANQLQVAQNAGDTSRQQKLINAEIALERAWIVADQKTLAKINAGIKDRHLSRAKHVQLLADRLAVLQEIGTVQGKIGSDQSSLTSLAGAGAGSGNLELALSSISLPTALEARSGVLAAQRGQSVTQQITNHINVSDLRAANQVGVVLDRSQSANASWGRARGIR